MNYYWFYVGDYQRDTMHLPPLQDLFYRRMLDWYYANERQLPLDRVSIHRLTRAVTDSEKNAVDHVIEEFWQKTRWGYVNRRAYIEINKAKHRICVAKENGKKGGRKNSYENPLGNPPGKQVETQRANSPSSNHQPILRTPLTPLAGGHKTNRRRPTKAQVEAQAGTGPDVVQVCCAVCGHSRMFHGMKPENQRRHVPNWQPHEFTPEAA